MRIAIATAAALTAVPALALADCPTRADVQASGIVVGFDDGSRIIYREIEPDTVIEIVRFDNPEDDFWVESHRGFWPTADGSFANGAPDPSVVGVSRYPVAIEDLPDIAPNMSWSGPVKNYSINSQEPNSAETLVARVGESHALTIGECVYQAMPGETAFLDDTDAGNNAFLEVVPELGVSLLVGDGDYGGPATSTYAPVSIKALP